MKRMIVVFTITLFLLINAISKPLPYCDEGHIQIGITSMCRAREK